MEAHPHTIPKLSLATQSIETTFSSKKYHQHEEKL